MCRGRLAPDLGPALLVTGEAQPAIHLPAGGKSGFLLKRLIEFDRVPQQLGDIGVAAQLADQAGSVESRSQVSLCFTSSTTSLQPILAR